MLARYIVPFDTTYEIWEDQNSPLLTVKAAGINILFAHEFKDAVEAIRIHSMENLKAKHPVTVDLKTYVNNLIK